MSRSQINLMLAALMIAFTLVLGGCDGNNGGGGNEDVIENNAGLLEGEDEGVIETEEGTGD